MKLRSIHIQNFKGVEDVRIDLVPKYLDGPLSLHAVLGDNGSGKTTVLQAIALTLSLATRRISRLSQFEWNGFLPERIASRGACRVQLEVVFEEDEIAATHEAFHRLKKQGFRPERNENPGDQREATLVFENWHVDSPEGPRRLWQFRGRHYANQLLAREPDAVELLPRVGGVFYYDQFRNVATTGTDRPRGKKRSMKRSTKNFGLGIRNLREALVGWWAYHGSDTKDKTQDYIPQIETTFADLFPGTRFKGVEPMPQSEEDGASAFYFMLERHGKVFDIEEMSSGEQAFFPLVCDFARSRIARSIVLLDELELHLHPPEQQGLLFGLPKLGPNCQFIVSTHSDYVSSTLLPGQKTRLLGGRLCL